jgi:hypothetical protein
MPNAAMAKIARRCPAKRAAGRAGIRECPAAARRHERLRGSRLQPDSSQPPGKFIFAIAIPFATIGRSGGGSLRVGGFQKRLHNARTADSKGQTMRTWKLLTGTVAAFAWGFFALAATSLARAEEPAESFADRVQAAERILVAIPEKDVDVAPGEQFLVEIDRVLRGSGTKGKLARVTNSGTKEQYPRYVAKKMYVFLLTKNKDGAGWINSGNSEIAIDGDKVRLMADGKVKEELTLAAFEALASGEEDPNAAAVAPRENPAGKWFLVMTGNGTDLYACLIDITKDGKGKYEARLVETAKTLIDSATLKEYEVTDRDVRIVLLSDGETFEFRGKFDQGKIRGTLLMGGGGSMGLGRLEATDATSMKKHLKPAPAAGQQEFVEAASQQDEAFAPLLKFVEKYSDSPLALDGYQYLISLAKSQDYDEAKFKKLAADYVRTAAPWGPLFELRAYIDLGLTLSRDAFLPELALEYLDTAEKKLTDDAATQWKILIRSEKGQLLLRGKDPAKGLALLETLHEDYPFHDGTTWLLARNAEQNKDNDKAIALYAELVSLPLVERMIVESQSQGQTPLPREQYPSQALARLWKAKHGGDSKGLADYLMEVYENSIRKIGGPKRPVRKEGEGNRVVLCELFTGTSCPPCVGADVASTALESAFEKSEVIVLRYHQNIPAPDPLSNVDSEERYSSYDGEGTPTLCVNGRQFAQAGGFMSRVPEIFRELHETVTPYLAEKTGLVITLSARANQGRIAIAAKASGLESFPEDVHLKLVLAEDKINFPADNGIRAHEMVVRAMPGGVDGIEPKKGQLAYEGEVDLAKLKTQLEQSLSVIETRTAMKFSQKPLDFKAFHLVAFLQNDDTGEILQATAIPVTGTLAISGETPRPAPRKAARAKAPSGAP